MLVDNSIVVIENIYRLRKEGVPVKEAAITGARGVAGAITSSTLTTISVFLPIVFTTGLTKQLFVDMGLTIGYSLVASLIVAVTFVPMMSAGVLNKVTQKDSKVINKLQTLYRKVMTRLLNRKIIVVAVTLALFAGSIFGAMNIRKFFNAKHGQHTDDDDDQNATGIFNGRNSINDRYSNEESKRDQRC